jgi:hypothetical protein
MNYQKGLLKDLYGEGTPDPSKLHGFDMEEASRVFRTIARRGGVGHAAHVERNASGMTRLAAGIDNAVDPMVKEAMEKVRAEMGNTDASAMRRAKIMANATEEEKQRYTSDSSAMDSAEMLEISKTMSGLDGKQREAVSKIANAPDAVFTNKDGRKKVAKVVEQTIEGMASLADIYGELSDTELHQKLEELSGMRITNFSQARQATAMVNQLRGAAEISGMDPRAFMEFAASTQASLQGSVMRIGGFDERTASQAKGITAVMNTQMLTDAAVTSKMAAQTNKQAEDMGYAPGMAPTTDEVYADLRQGREFFMNEYKGATLAMGGTQHLPKEAQAKLAGLMTEFREAGKSDDPSQKRAEIENQIQAVYAEAASRDGKYHTFGEYFESREAKSAMNRAMAQPGSAREIDQMTLENRMQDTNVNTMLNRLEEEGVVGGEDTRALGNTMMENVGAQGMLDLREASESKLLREKGPAAVKERQMQILDRAGLKGEEAEDFLGRFYDGEGKMKNAESYRTTVEQMLNSNWTPGQSVYEREQKASQEIDMLGANSQGVRLRDENKGFSLSSVVTSLATGKAKGIQDRESMAIAVQALSEEGVSLPSVDLKDAEGNPMLMRDEKGNPILDDKGQVQTKKVDMGKEVASGINFATGVDAKGMEKLEKVFGGDLGLHTKLGYKTKEEMYDATSKSNVARADALKMLFNDEAYSKLNIRGTAGAITAISDDAWAAAQQTDVVQNKVGQMAAIERLEGGGMMSKGQISDLKKKAMSGELKRGDFGMFEAEAAVSEVEDRKFGWGDKDSEGHLTATMGDGLGRIKNLAWTTTKANESELAGLAQLNNAGGGAMVEEMEKQLKNLEKTAAESGATRVEYAGADGKKDHFYLGENSEDIKALKDAISKLREASNQGKGEERTEVMHVTTLKVENWDRK